MVNASLNWASIVGIVLAVGGALLYFMRSFKPALARDYDVFFAAVGLLCGGIGAAYDVLLFGGEVVGDLGAEGLEREVGLALQGTGGRSRSSGHAAVDACVRLSKPIIPAPFCAEQSLVATTVSC